MGKRKIALFYDEGTESGKQILEFLMPFDKRKSDIVGELILLWIAEHGTNVPVQWLDRRKGEPGAVGLRFPERASAVGSEAGVKVGAGAKVGFPIEGYEKHNDKARKIEADAGPEKSEEEVQDISMIKAGLAAFM